MTPPQNNAPTSFSP